MYSCSYGMRNLVLLICFESSIGLCIGPYSCMLFRMCIATQKCIPSTISIVCTCVHARAHVCVCVYVCEGSR
jgi:hypothetical protein